MDDFGVVGGCVESLLSLGCMVAIVLSYGSMWQLYMPLSVIWSRSMV